MEDDQLDLSDLLKEEEPIEAPPITSDAKPPEGEPRSVQEEGGGPPPAGPAQEAKVVGVMPPAPAAPPPSGQQVAKPVEAKPPQEPPPVVPPTPPLPAAPKEPPTVKPPGLTKEQVEALRKQHIEALTKRFTVSKEEAEGLLVEPEKVLPAMIARAQMDSFDAAAALISTMVPQIVAEVTARQRQDNEAESKFRTRWPQLNKPEHVEKITQVAKVYRALNPNAPLDEVIENVGMQACIMLRLPLETSSTEPSAQPPARSKPPAPVGVGASGGGPVKPGAEDFWRDLYESARGD